MTASGTQLTPPIYYRRVDPDRSNTFFGAHELRSTLQRTTEPEYILRLPDRM